MDWEHYEKIEDEDDLNNLSQTEKENLYYIPDTWLHPFYLEALNILFRYENTLRVFVYSILKSRQGKEWANTPISSDLTISSAAKQRKNQYNKFGYLGDKMYSPMMFLNSGELIHILNDDTRWSMFSQHFDADRSVIIHKMNEINAIRNSLAHFRPVSEDDIILLKQNIKHVFVGVSSYMSQLYSLFNYIPSNVEDGWYKELNEVDAIHSGFNFAQSENGDLVQVKLIYRTPFTSTSISNRSASIFGPRFQVEKLFKEFPKLCKSTIYITDSCDAYNSQNIKEPQACKVIHTVNFVFSRAEIVKNQDAIVADFISLIAKIDEEVGFIFSNNLAHGKLLVPERAYLTWLFEAKNPHWSIKSSFPQFQTNANKIVEVEYWGAEQTSLWDDITQRSKMPWIHSNISPKNTMMEF